jgi:hypothetical protein
MNRILIWTGLLILVVIAAGCVQTAKTEDEIRALAAEHMESAVEDNNSIFYRLYGYAIENVSRREAITASYLYEYHHWEGNINITGTYFIETEPAGYSLKREKDYYMWYKLPSDGSGAMVKELHLTTDYRGNLLKRLNEEGLEFNVERATSKFKGREIYVVELSFPSGEVWFDEEGRAFGGCNMVEAFILYSINGKPIGEIQGSVLCVL